MTTVGVMLVIMGAFSVYAGVKGYSLPCLLRSAIEGADTSSCRLSGGSLAELVTAALAGTALLHHLSSTSIIPGGKSRSGSPKERGKPGAKSGRAGAGDAGAADAGTAAADAGTAAADAGSIGADIAGVAGDVGLAGL